MIVGFYFDDDAADQAILKGLALNSMPFETTVTQALRGEDDEVHLRRAALLGLCIVTCNQSDFVRLNNGCISSGEDHAGIVIIAQQRWSAGERLRRLLRLARAYTPEEMRNRIEFLSDWGDDRDTAR